MIVIFGEKSYGKVDRVSGVCYVLTVFAHLNFLPLFPLRSFIVLEGTESGGEFRGKQIGVSLKSAFAGYVRVWLGAVALIAGGVACVGLFNAAGALGLNAVVSLAPLALGVGLLLSLLVRGKAGGAIQIGVHLLSAVVWYVFADAAGGNRRVGLTVGGHLFALGLANAALLVFGLTRLFDRAGPGRTRELLRELGAEMPNEDDDGDDPREGKWEGWDEGEDRRRRGGRYE